eukprot:IDg10849t1
MAQKCEYPCHDNDVIRDCDKGDECCGSTQAAQAAVNSIMGYHGGASHALTKRNLERKDGHADEEERKQVGNEPLQAIITRCDGRVAQEDGQRGGSNGMSPDNTHLYTSLQRATAAHSRHVNNALSMSGNRACLMLIAVSMILANHMDLKHQKIKNVAHGATKAVVA